ncbi:GGDEF domain-containing protein [Betaproteobacteria bacterium SCN2]|jgi:diguanylate cyclase (GGDEF)-like protein|nr:GGDEF domain-containing protein [Betaproteobacteria bacterium SCN2]
MLLDNKTLLFSLVLISGLMAVSLAVVSRSGARDGLRTWALSMGLESLAWALISQRGGIPDAMSILMPNLLLAAALAMKLAAIHEFQGRSWPRWKCLLPVALMLALMVLLEYDDFRGRLVYGGLIYAAQMLLIVHALHADAELRKGRAWWLLGGVTAAMVPILALRSLAAFFGVDHFATVEGAVAPNTIQLLVFVCLMALNLLGSLGFVLMEKERSDLELRSLAMTDFLTRALNRRAFTERAEQQMALAQRTGQPLALLMIDVDHFKQINDEHGHAAGDSVLVEIARVIGSNIRKQDTLGRYGGEEFGVLLPATDQAGALVVAEKLRKAVEAMRCRVKSKSVSVTISIGVTVCLANCERCQSDLHKLLGDADRALYQAKHGGRNCAAIVPVGCAVPRPG